MTRGFSCFFVILLIIQLNLILSSPESQRVFDIYVDNKVKVSGKGDSDSPYSELSEGLKKAVDLCMRVVEDEIITIWIAPSTNPYNCGDDVYYFLGEGQLTLRIRMWKDQPSCQDESYCFESPVITFQDTLFNFDDMVSIEMSDLLLSHKDGAFWIQRSALSLENITFTSVERVKGELFSLLDTRALNITNLVVKMEVVSPMLAFATDKKKSAANVSMKNIQVYSSCFEDGFTLDSPIFKFVTLEGNNDILTIEDFWIKSLDAELGIDAQTVLAINGFRSVSIEKFYLEDSQVYAKGRSSFVSLKANQKVQISGLNMQRNRFVVAKATDPLFFMEGIASLEILDSCFSGNKFQGPESDPLVIINPDAIVSASIADFRVSENILNGHINIFEFSEFARQSTPKSVLKISKITISDNTNLKSTNQFSFVLAENSQFTEMTLEDIDYSLNSLSGRVFAVGFPLTFSKALTTGGPVIGLKKIRIRWNINAVDTNFLYFIPSQKDISTWICEPNQEPYRLLIEDLVLTENSFSKGSNLLWFSEVGLFQIQYSLAWLKDILIANNTFESYSVIMIDQRASSFSMNSSEVSNNSFEQSHLINSNYASSGIPCNPDSKPQGATKILYRYGIVINSNFTNLKVNSGALLKANHGFFMLHSARFSNITLQNSKLISMAFSLFRLPPNSPGYREDSITESLLFNGWEGKMGTFFQNNLQKRTSADCIYMYSVEQNMFENITLNAATLIYLTGYGFNRSYINFESNNFTNLALRAGSPTPLVYFESIDNLKFVKNRFNDIKGNLQILSMPQSQSSSLIAFDQNDFFFLRVSSLVSYSGERLQTVSFSDNQINFSEFSQTVIGLNSKVSSGDWLFEKMDMYNVGITVNSSNSQAERYAFFLLFAANTTNKKSQINFTDCVFENIWVYAASKKDLPTETNLISVGSLQALSFKGVQVIAAQIQTSGNLIYILNSPSVAIEDSTFQNISIKSQTGMISTFAFKVLIRGSSFRSIQNYFTHGVLYLSPSAHNYSVRIEDCFFLGILTQKGAVFSSQPGLSLQYGSMTTGSNNNYVLSLQVENCKIRSIANDNSFFIFGGRLSNSSISNVQFNSSFQTATPSAIFSNALVSGELSVRGLSLDPRIQVGNYLFELIGGNLSIILQDFVYDGRLTSLILARMNAGSLYVKDSEIKNLEMIQSLVKAMVTEDAQHSSSNSGASAKIYLKNTTFKGISFKNNSEIFSESFYSDLVSYAPDVKNKVVGIVRAGIPTWISVENCTFEDILSMPAILIIQTPGFATTQKIRPLINISNSEFRRVTFVSGPALTILPNKYNPIVTIEKTLFELNSAVIGGALAVYNCALNVSQATFRDNSAVKIGGAILLGEDATDLSDLPKSVFENNNAASFGSVVSEALNFKMSFLPDEKSGIETLVGTMKPDPTTPLTLINVTNHEFQKGVIKLDFLNARGEPAPDLLSSRQFSFLLPTSSKENGGNSFFGVSCQWNQDFSSCEIPLKGMTIAGNAGDLLMLKFQYVSSKGAQSKSILLQIRPCLLGEYNTSSVCEPCTGQTYTVNTSVACTHCPPNAICQDQARICPVSGYWNADIHSAKIHPCNDNKDGRCQRSPDDCGGCKTGYTGPLCWACDLENGYVESGYLECSQCEDTSKSLILAILVGSGYLICQLFFVYIFFTGASQTSSQDDVPTIEFRKVERCFYIKSLLTYSQLMSILCLTNSQVYGYFGLTSQVGNLGSLINYGTQCAMMGLNLARENFIYYQTYLIIAAPWIQFIFTALVVIVASLFKRSLSIGKAVSAALIYLIFFMQPGLVTNLTLFLSCNKLGGMKYNFIASHPYWSCDSEIYGSVSHFLALPNLLLWALIIPVIIFLILKRNKENLQNDKYEGSLGVLVFDLKKKYYFWGVAQMIFKVILAVLVYGLEVEIEVQIFSFLLLLWIYQSLVRVTKPFSRPHFNKFETIVMNLLIFNIIVAKYLIDPINGPWLSQTSFVVSVIINASFILYIAWKVLMSTFFTKIQQSVEDQIDLPNTSSSGLTDKLLENDSQQEED